MLLSRNADPSFHDHLPAIAHSTLAGHASGLNHLSVWRQRLAPGAATPLHRHECEEVVLITSGSGTVTVGEETEHFEADSTLVFPAGTVHQIVNTGTEPLEILAVFAETPVRVWLPDGTALELPWRS